MRRMLPGAFSRARSSAAQAMLQRSCTRSEPLHRLQHTRGQHELVPAGRNPVRNNPSRCRSASNSDPSFLELNNGERIIYPSKREFHPSLDLSRRGAVELQLKALQKNNVPYPDHGVEVLYRFSAFDPWTRSRYFGRSLDLGQFERFRRVMHIQAYSTLLDLEEFTFLSDLEVTDTLWKQRVLVSGSCWKEQRTYEFTMTQRQGGAYDGFWFCQSLLCDGCDDMPA